METANTQSSQQPHTRPCPSCRQLISVDARKCYHCGELVGSHKTTRYVMTKFVGYVGVLTALLSTFYALREGYFYVKQQQQAREEVRSFQAVSRHFESLGSLEYAEQALQKALQVMPNDRLMKQHLFLLRCRRLFEEFEWQTTLSDEQLQQVNELIVEGHRLQQHPLDKKMDVDISLSLGRLIPNDGAWNDDKATRLQFERSLALQPDNAEALFRYGIWLVGSEVDATQGEQYMRRATTLQPDNALYHYELGKFYFDQGAFLPALNNLQTAIKLKNKQTSLVNIQAANYAKVSLRGLFIAATNAYDITSDDFMHLSETAREEWIVQLLAIKDTDRQVNRRAFDFYLSVKKLNQAAELIERLISQRELEEPVKGYTLEDKQRYLALLRAKNEQPDLQQKLAADITEFQQSQRWEEFLHWGIEGKHRYKVGLRVEKGVIQDGLKVLKVFSGFPFAKGNIKAGDIIQRVGHQRVKELNHVMQILDRFNPGDAVPIQILRNTRVLELSLIVE